MILNVFIFKFVLDESNKIKLKLHFCEAKRDKGRKSNPRHQNVETRILMQIARNSLKSIVSKGLSL